MLRDKMLGSIRDSSVSGVFRIRPTGRATVQSAPGRTGGVLGPCLGWRSKTVKPHQGTDSLRAHKSTRQAAVAVSLPAWASALSRPPCHRPSHNLSF